MQTDTSSVESFTNLVEYCHGNSSTPMGAKRIADGHPETYNVKYFEVMMTPALRHCSCSLSLCLSSVCVRVCVRGARSLALASSLALSLSVCV
eukprot:COSAG05_NODE_12326_length_472_cov_1.107239_1_plen_92_part_01